MRKAPTSLFFRFVPGTLWVGASLCLWVLLGCANTFSDSLPDAAVPSSPTNIALVPLTTEDLSGPCVFDLLLQQPGALQAGTLVIYERGDSSVLYEDATLRAAASRLNFSMVFAHECDAASTHAFQADAGKGPARVLFAALQQFAANTAHPELATNGLVLCGFSAAAVLTVTMANQYPDRLLGAVEYAPGDTYVNLQTLTASPAALKIPTLVLANAQDPLAGTFRSLDYFTRGRARGALWSYGVQNATGHCCNLSTRNMLVPFLHALADAQAAPGQTSPLYPGHLFGIFTCSPDQTLDAQRQTDCAISHAELSGTLPAGTSGWLPDQATADAWLTWVRNTTTN